jgi:glycosyltransferase involved in cell wall biosynthesis
MRASIIIPTYNRAEKIINTLNALQRQTNAHFDIVVVVDGAKDDTAARLSHFKSVFPLKVIDQENRGRSGARNEGVKESAGDLLIFYDDDMLPYEDSVSKHIAFHSDHPGAAILAGYPAEFETKDKTDFQNYRAWLNERWLAPYREGLTRMDFQNFFLAGANFSIKRSAFVALNGFSISLRDNEDYDLAYRALEENQELWFDRNNIAIHDDPITCSSYIRRLKQYRAEESKLMRLYPKSQRAKTRLKEKISPVKKSIYWIFAWPLWNTFIDRFNILRLLPKKIRYNLYDIITHSQSVVFNKGDHAP